MTSIIQKIRTSSTTQLTLWVASLVTAISVVVIGLLAKFSQDVIFDETVDTTLQTMETTALRIGNILVRKLGIHKVVETYGCRANSLEKVSISSADI